MSPALKLAQRLALGVPALLLMLMQEMEGAGKWLVALVAFVFAALAFGVGAPFIGAAFGSAFASGFTVGTGAPCGATWPTWTPATTPAARSPASGDSTVASSRSFAGLRNGAASSAPGTPMRLTVRQSVRAASRLIGQQQ